jgi:uncharacterized RDD family membrane protein YckC
MDNTAELAGRWHRLGGAILDTIAVMIISMPVTMIVSNIYFPGAMEFSGSFKDSLLGADKDFGFTLASVAITIGAFLLLNGYLLIRDGQSIGKKVIGMRIVTLEGEIPPFTRIILLRHVLVMLITHIPVAGTFIHLADVLFIFRGDKRCLHDHLAGTRVVKA